jgi:hypothetical protein
MKSTAIRRTIAELSTYLEEWKHTSRPKPLVLQAIFSQEDSVDLFKTAFLGRKKNALEMTFKIGHRATKIAGPAEERVHTIELIPQSGATGDA